MLKKLILSLTATALSLSAIAQNANCSGAAAFCSGTTTYAAGVGAGTAQAGPNYGCLGSQPNPAWFFMQVSASGNITLAITASPPRDIDFILYGPFSSPTCTGLTAANTEDCSYAGGTATEYADIIGGIAGEYYMLLLTNYSNQPTTVSFSQTSGSGSTSCAVLCSMTGLTATPTACNPATNTYSVSGQVAFTTQPTTGTLTVTNSCGGSQTFNAPFTSPINYNIGGVTANGGTCTITATFSATPSCTRTQTYTAPPNCTPCTATANNNGPICSGTNLNLTAGAVTGATSYSWSGPGGYTSSLQNPTIGAAPATAAGTYTVTVTTPSATCTATTTVVVNQTPAAPAVSNNGPVCSGATLNLTGPTVAGATYNWTGPGGFTSSAQSPSIPSATTANAGTYILTVTVNGCTSPAGTTSAVVNNTPSPPIPMINGSATPAPICSGGATPSTITLTANNIAGATYSWTGPNGYTAAVRNPPALTGVTPVMGGTYSLTVTVGGCTSAPATVSIVVTPTPAAPTAAGASICSGATATLTATAPGSAYHWYDAATGGTLLGVGATYTTPALTTSTTYYVQSTISGCVGPRSAVIVNVSPSFSVSTIADDSICAGASFTLGISSPSAAGYTFSWDEPANPGFSTAAAPTVTPVSTSTYTVTLTDTIGCTGSDVITVTVGTPLTLNATGSPANCFASCDGQGTAVVSGSFPPYSYYWSNSVTTPTATGLCANTYSVTITDLIGCTIQDTILVTEPTAISLTTSTVTSHCNQPDGSATVVANGGSGGYSYYWSPGTQLTATATNLTPGTYSVVVNDSHACPDSASATVPNAPGVVASVTSTTAITCNNGCDGTATVTATSGTGPYLYSWSNGQITATATSLCAGTYTCTVTDSTGCTDTAVVTIAQPPAVMVDALAPVTICTGQSATLTATATGGSGGYMFGWNAPAYAGNPNVVSPTTTTTYTVGATDSQGCISANTQSVTVTVRPPLSITASNDEAICPGANVTLSAVAGGGNASGYTYSWMPGSGTASTFNVSPAVTTTYTVTLTDACTSVAATDVVTVTVLSLPTPNFTVDVSSGCAPLCVKFVDNSTVSAGGTITSWNWSMDGQNLLPVNGDTMHCFNNGGQYSVTLTTTSNSGCVNTLTIPNMITVYDMPTAHFTYDPNPISINYPTVSFNDQSSHTTGWNWNFGDLLADPADNTSNVPNPNHSYSDVGTYCVQLTVSNTPACTDKDSVCLVVEPDFTFYIPNSFTPDGSGLNEEFYAKGENIAQFDMQIYDRWGNLVFHATDINKHWNGTMKGTGSEIVPMDVYVYIINLTDKIGEKHQYIGHVTVIK